MNTQNSPVSSKHDIVIKERNHIDICGVREVVSFDEVSVLMVTTGGEMTVEGSDLKIGALDTDRGLVSIDGKINAVIYEDPNEDSAKRGILGRMFKR